MCHDPFSRSRDDKATAGKAEDGFVFLGYDIRPGLFQPSRQARQKIVSAVEGHIYVGRKAIAEVSSAANSFESRQRYAQTLVLIDKVLRGWGDAFAYGNAPSQMEDLDRKVDSLLDEFRAWFSIQVKGKDWKTKRRLGGVCLLSDIGAKSLDDVPFSLEKGPRFVTSSRTVTISTDGSTVTQGRRKGKDQGPGGWAFVVHGTGEERGGHVPSATNNQMELRAVIEAIRFVGPDNSIIVRTDSQYVADAINRGAVIKTNADLWNEFREVSRSRRVSVRWIKGHAGDPHNHRADTLAAGQANLAKSLSRTAA